MEGLLAIRERLRRHDILLSALQDAVNAIGPIVLSSGAPEGLAIGRWYFDLTDKNLYFNPNKNSTTGWVLIS